MMHCNRCGHPVSMTADACRNCGSRTATAPMAIGHWTITALMFGFILWVLLA